MTVPDGRLTAILLAVALSGCGGQSGQPATPTSTTSTPAPPSLTATITIRPAGITPMQVDILVGGHVKFVNADVQIHDMLSDPLHVHNDCPAMNYAGFLSPGQSRDTAAFDEARTCGFHDHTREDDLAFRGTIVVH